MILAGDLRKGVTFVYDGNIYVVVDFLHVKPAKAQLSYANSKTWLRERCLKRPSTRRKKFRKGHD